MLSKEERKLIDENIVNYYHLVVYNSHVFGEPFLLDNYLYYFDGNIATLVSPRLGKEMDEVSLNNAISEIIKKHLPDNFIFWGETPTKNIKEQSGFQLHKEDIQLWRRELIFKTENFKPTKKYRYYQTKAKKEGLKLNFVDMPFYKSEYTKLLAETHNKLVGLKSISYYSIFPSLKRTKFVEVLKENKIISVNIIIEALQNYICFAEIGYDKLFNRASGISKSMLIEYYLGKTKYISWGGCASEGVYNYKREIIGKIPICFYDNYIRYEFYKKERAKWWLFRMHSG